MACLGNEFQSRFGGKACCRDEGVRIYGVIGLEGYGVAGEGGDVFAVHAHLAGLEHFVDVFFEVVDAGGGAVPERAVRFSLVTRQGLCWAYLCSGFKTFVLSSFSIPQSSIVAWCSFCQKP